MNEDASSICDEQRTRQNAPGIDCRRKRWLWTLGSMVVGLAVLGGIWIAARDSLVPRNWGVVDEGLVYRSGQLSPNLVRPKLERLGIRTIVDLTEIDPDNPEEAAERDAACDLGVALLELPLSGDGRGEIGHYADAIAAITKAVASESPLLVHCAAGAQRTGGVIACYRMLVQGRDVENARAEMIRYGWDPERDRVLTEFLNANMQELATELAERAIIPRVPDPLPRFP